MNSCFHFFNVLLENVCVRNQREEGRKEGERMRKEIHDPFLNVKVRGQLLEVGSLLPLEDLNPVQVLGWCGSVFICIAVFLVPVSLFEAVSHIQSRLAWNSGLLCL